MSAAGQKKPFKTDLPTGQKAVRFERVTGSTDAAMLGFDPYTSPSQAVRISRGLEEFKGNELTDAGNDMEDGIVNMVERHYDIETYKPDSIFHPDEDFFVVHPDRLCEAECLGIQIKNHSPHMARYVDDPGRYKAAPGAAGRWDNNLVPRAYLIQCLVEMNVVAAAMGEKWGDYWVLASHFGGANLRIYQIKNDRKLWAGILHASKIFWADHLDPNGPRLMPDDRTWRPKKQEKRRTKPLTGADLLATPLPKYSKG